MVSGNGRSNPSNRSVNEHMTPRKDLFKTPSNAELERRLAERDQREEAEYPKHVAYDEGYKNGRDTERARIRAEVVRLRDEVADLSNLGAAIKSGIQLDCYERVLALLDGDGGGVRG